MSKNRIDQEKRVVELMIRLYCRKKEKNVTLCPNAKSCFAMRMPGWTAAFGRKEACKQCSVHCYKPAMRERMKQVMRFSGPRMLIYAPWEAIRHLFG
ncbi:nitrous oxide-stimulated promoter family protein [Bacteroides hominis]|uniref:nitrous oxide-stimulated promoter family protein n=1 Tax=Bacteroides hominis TaxID=2763023 RepID=UPI0022961068|nr:nitrous oxide-stimulated promoter family protein [Bacteroides fragilis]